MKYKLKQITPVIFIFRFTTFQKGSMAKSLKEEKDG